MDGCIEWPGAVRRRSYGQCRVGGRMVYAHRKAWEDANGPIPDGLYVLHRCDNRPCVNVAHLYLGRPADNMRDAVERRRMPYGRRHWTARIRYPLARVDDYQPKINVGAANNRAKLSEDQARSIIRELADGVPIKELAERYGLSRDGIASIRHGRSWRHLPRP